ncbi:MAG: transposase, partial [Cyanobacteriota bacterium]
PWIRDTQRHEEAHRYPGTGAGVMGSLRTAALNLLRMAGFASFRSAMQSVMDDIGQLVEMARRQPDQGFC